MGLRTLYINAEARFSQEWATIQGVNLEELILVDIAKGTSAEDMLQLYIDTAAKDMADVIVLDSITALSPTREIEETMDKESMGLAPAKLSKFFRMCKGYNYAANNGNGICGVFVAQYRDTMDKYSQALAKVPGGHAKDHYAEYIILCGSKAAQETNRVTRDTGFIMTMDFLKTDSRFRNRIEFEFEHGVGLDPVSDIIDNAIKFGVIEKQPGGYYLWKDSNSKETRLRGVKNVMDTIREDAKLVASLKKQLEEKPVVETLSGEELIYEEVEAEVEEV